MAFTFLVDSPKAGLHAALSFLMAQDNLSFCCHDDPLNSEDKNTSEFPTRCDLCSSSLRSFLLANEQNLATAVDDCIPIGPSICHSIAEPNKQLTPGMTPSATQCLFLRPLSALKVQRGMIEVEERWATKKHLLERVGIKYLSDNDMLGVLCHLHLALDPIKCVLIELDALHENLKGTHQKLVWEVPALAATVPRVEMVIVIDPQTQLDWTKAPYNLNRIHISV